MNVPCEIFPGMDLSTRTFRCKSDLDNLIFILKRIDSNFSYKRVGSTRFVRSGSVWGSFSNVSFANAFSNSADRING